MVHFDKISDYNTFNDTETRHPRINIIDLAKAKPRRGSRMFFSFYAIFLKEVKCGDIHYGRHTYDYQEGTLLFLAPGQAVGVISEDVTFQPKGRVLVFDPDFIHGTSLGKQIHDYSFFQYRSNEALHLSKQERQTVLDCFSRINLELEGSVDDYGRQLIISNIKLFLNYCNRFYDRQLKTREHVNQGVLERFEGLLDNYFMSEKLYSGGRPSISYFSDRMDLSANYFSDLVKKETGKSAQEHIQAKLINTAKGRLLDKRGPINEIARDLGFEYSHNFSRLFKRHVGQTPLRFRNTN